jgi:ATP-dependent DNA helicase RecQ
MLDLLKTHFGYSAFRPLQEDVINTILAEKDALVLMPTGGGKSLCYQLPALRLPGVTLVISPLIALMKDQVDSLKANGVPAVYLNSTVPFPQQREIEQQVYRGDVKILYIAPERLALPAFQDYLRSLQISLIAIDEAHCISEWGHDFRPDYRNLHLLRRQFPEVPCIALTATATEQVRVDIIKQLELDNASRFIASFNRENLHYHVEQKHKTFERVCDLLDQHKDQPAIIYCFSRKDTEKWASNLRAEGYEAAAYHAGLDPTVRRNTQEKFIRDEVPIIVATIAFGMGINKPDVRLIIHTSLPKTLEGYYQETGRAGRDGLKSDCVLFYSYGDKHKQDFFINQMEEEQERVHAREKLGQIISFCESSVCRRAYVLEYFGESWPQEKCSACDNCLEPSELFDATEVAQKILSAVIRTGERYGLTYVIDVLKGSRSKVIRERGHGELSVFGIVSDFSKQDLRHIARQVVGKGLIEQYGKEYPTFRMTDAGRLFLIEKTILQLPMPKSRAVVGGGKKSDIAYDAILFERLRAIRKQIASDLAVPPFVIFGDKSLHEMAYYMPQSDNDFATIFGVGKEKLARFGSAFLKEISCYITETGKQGSVQKKRTSEKVLNTKRKGSTYDATRELLAQGFSFDHIAKQRGFAISTIIGHVEKLRAAGEVISLDHLQPSGKRFEQIKKAFLQTGSTALTPVRALLGDDFSYDELRLSRLFLI